MLFELLAAKPRRHLLLTLCDEDSVSIPDGLITRGSGTVRHAGANQAPREPTVQSTPRETFEVELIHTHLPKLKKEGLIEWDRDHQTVQRGPAFPEIEPALGLLIKNATAFPSGLL